MFKLRPGDRRLSPDGSNAAGVLANMKSWRPESVQCLADFLTANIPEIVSVDSNVVGNRLGLQFHQRVTGAPRTLKYYVDSMSDGTLRSGAGSNTVSVQARTVHLSPRAVREAVPRPRRLSRASSYCPSIAATAIDTCVHHPLTDCVADGSYYGPRSPNSIQLRQLEHCHDNRRSLPV